MARHGSARWCRICFMNSWEKSSQDMGCIVHTMPVSQTIEVQVIPQHMAFFFKRWAEDEMDPQNAQGYDDWTRRFV